MKLPVTLALCLHLFLLSAARAQFLDSLQLQVGTNATVAARDYQPLWLVANRRSTITDQKADLSTHINFTNKHMLGNSSQFEKQNGFSIAYGIDLYNNNHFKSVFLQEGYVKASYHHWQLQAGRYEEMIGTVDPELSSGSMAISNNARPIPRIGIGVDDYVSVPFTRNWLKFKFSFAHGWMGKDRVVDHAYLHQKSLYVKVGKERLNFYGGIAHFAIWGGEHPQLGTLPHSFKDFIRVVLKKQGGEDAPVSEALNRLGNHLGMTDVGMQFLLNTWDFTLYYQTPFEDYSGFLLFRNPDHLAGMRIKKRSGLINAITLEYMDTRDQSGPVHPPGVDNYYNHALYTTGWVYRGNTLGTPLFLTSKRTQQYFGENAGSTFWNIINNRIHGIHLGISGDLTARLQYRTLLTYTENYGMYGMDKLFPAPRKQGYILQELTYTHAVWKVTAALGLDAGDLTNNTGASLGIAYELAPKP